MKSFLFKLEFVLLILLKSFHYKNERIEEVKTSLSARRFYSESEIQFRQHWMWAGENVKNLKVELNFPETKEQAVEIENQY